MSNEVKKPQYPGFIAYQTPLIAYPHVGDESLKSKNQIPPIELWYIGPDRKPYATKEGLQEAWKALYQKNLPIQFTDNIIPKDKPGFTKEQVQALKDFLQALGESGILKQPNPEEIIKQLTNVLKITLVSAPNI